MAKTFLEKVEDYNKELVAVVKANMEYYAAKDGNPHPDFTLEELQRVRESRLKYLYEATLGIVV